MWLVYSTTILTTKVSLSAHSLQLSRNLRDSPRFLAIVPGTGRLYYCSDIINPATSYNYEQDSCGSVLQSLTFAVTTMVVQRGQKCQHIITRVSPEGTGMSTHFHKGQYS